MTVLPLALRLRQAGIVYPVWTNRAAHLHNVPLPLLCAFLMQETGGGRNVFGHDPTIFVGAGDVTQAKYLAYRHLRDFTHECQGVGPMQLTSRSLQDAADQAGGCWIPRVNIAVGAHLIRQLLDQHPGNPTDAYAAYNGSGPAARRYAIRIAALRQHFADLLGTAGITAT